jgi:hypothetical protein
MSQPPISLPSLVNSFRGCQIIGLDTLTQVDLKGGRANPHSKRITKLVTGSRVMVFKNGVGYLNMVNRRLAHEKEAAGLLQALADASTQTGILNSPIWTPGPRQWGSRIPDSPFITHQEKMYLECIFLQAGRVSYFLDGQPIDKQDIQGFPDPKTEGDQGGLVNKVIIRTYSFDSILRVRKSKQVYTIQP